MSNRSAWKMFAVCAAAVFGAPFIVGATELEGGWRSADPGANGLVWNVSFRDASCGWLCGIRIVDVLRD